MNRRIGYGVITFLLSFVFLCGLFATIQPLAVVQAARLKTPLMQDEGQVYFVEAGDSLYKIATKFYENGSLWPTIEKATNEKAQTDKTFAVISDPQYLRVGQKLWIPNVTTNPAPKIQPSVRFVSPANGATLPPTFQVMLSATGVKVEPSGDVRPNSGHMHILIDEEFVDAGEVIINDSSHLHYGKGQVSGTLTLSPGVHVLRLQFSDGAHMALVDPNLRDTITVTVTDSANEPTAHGVRFVSPQNGATVSGTFEVLMAATGVAVEPAGAVHENAGHMHILIDEEFVDAGEVVINDESHHHYGKGQLTATLTLDPGVHVLRLQLADGAHMALDDTALQDTITVVVASDVKAVDVKAVDEQRVKFVAPGNGATVSSTFDVVMAATGVTIEPAGTIHENAGHMHILVDEDFVSAGELVINDETHLHFGKGQLTTTLTLDPGVHILHLQLADGAHMAFDDLSLQDTITITVTE